ncbi:MAG: zinc-binding dehydrogenase [Xanthobacteraceae bacterium]|nr:zinc-binding dehydrogenase [Xanthobacteraceae bacterium]
MKAAVIDRHGGPDVFRLVAMPRPRPATGELLVRVLACGLNHGLDGRSRQNGAGRKIQFPHILGTEIVGRVEECGPQADRTYLGKNVIVVPWIACGTCRECQAGNAGSCPDFRLRGIHVSGGNAEYVAVPDSQVVVLPDHASVVEAAALPVSYTTACVLINRAQLRKAETILVLGAAGTVGIAATQIATAAGAQVLAAAGSREKLEFARTLGASSLIDYTKPDWSRQVMDATGGRGVDVVIEHIGATTWPESVASLASRGRLAMCGASSGWDLQISARELWRKNITFHFANSGSTPGLMQVVELWSSGKIKPVIAGTFPLHQISKAHEMLSRRDLIGKLILTMT